MHRAVGVVILLSLVLASGCTKGAEASDSPAAAHAGGVGWLRLSVNEGRPGSSVKATGRVADQDAAAGGAARSNATGTWRKVEQRGDHRSGALLDQVRRSASRQDGPPPPCRSPTGGGSRGGPITPRHACRDPQTRTDPVNDPVNDPVTEPVTDPVSVDTDHVTDSDPHHHTHSGAESNSDPAPDARLHPTSMGVIRSRRAVRRGPLHRPQQHVERGRIRRPTDTSVCSYQNWFTQVTAGDRVLGPGGEDHPNVHKDYRNWSTGIEPLVVLHLDQVVVRSSRTRARGIYNIAYDLWLNGVPGEHEVMIWTDNTADRRPGPSRGQVTVSGRRWDLFATSSNSHHDLPPSNGARLTSGYVDLKAFLDHLDDIGLEPPGATLGQVGYGVEVATDIRRAGDVRVHRVLDLGRAMSR